MEIGYAEWADHMDTKNQIVLVTSAVAALVALVGYFLNQTSIRRERRSRIYAEALSVVFQYQELPFRIRRRTQDPESSMALAQRISDTFERLAFHQAWMNLESPVVALAFANLVERTDVQWPAFCEHAWRQPPPSEDADFQVSDWTQYDFDNEHERQLCILAMQRDLRIGGSALRRSTRRRITQQRTWRRANLAAAHDGRTAPP